MTDQVDDEGSSQEEKASDVDALSSLFLEALGFDLSKLWVTKAVLTLEAGQEPRLDVSLIANDSADLTPVTDEYRLVKRCE